MATYRDEKGSEYSESLLSSSDCHHEAAERPRRSNVSIAFVAITIVNIVLFAASIFLYTASIRTTIIWSDPSSYYSPINDKLQLHWEPKQFNGSLLGGTYKSIGQLPPGASTNAAWDDVTRVRPIAISAEEVRKLGKDPKTVAKIPADAGYGDDAYLASVNVFHQIHCLDTLRRLAFDKSYGAETPEKLHNGHIGHCVNALYEQLACKASTEIYTMQWMDTQTHPFPDFSINTQCRSIDALFDYQAKHAVDEKMWLAMRKPDDVEAIPIPELLLEAVSEHDHHR